MLIETEEFVWGRFPQTFMEKWCEKCRRYVRMTNLAAAAHIVGLDKKTLEVWATTGKVHTTFSDGGESLLCLSSLLLN